MTTQPDREIQALIDSARDRYLTEVQFHAKVKVAARVLQRIHPEIEDRDAIRTALAMFAAAEKLGGS